MNVTEYSRERSRIRHQRRSRHGHVSTDTCHLHVMHWRQLLLFVTVHGSLGWRSALRCSAAHAPPHPCRDFKDAAKPPTRVSLTADLPPRRECNFPRRSLHAVHSLRSAYSKRGQILDNLCGLGGAMGSLCVFVCVCLYPYPHNSFQSERLLATYLARWFIYIRYRSSSTSKFISQRSQEQNKNSVSARMVR